MLKLTPSSSSSPSNGVLLCSQIPRLHLPLTLPPLPPVLLPPPPVLLRPQRAPPPLFPLPPPSTPIPCGWDRQRWSRCSRSPLGLDVLHRSYSSSSGEADKIEYSKDSGELIAEKGAEALQEAAPALGEVAAAAADSALPVAALQYLIDAVHSFTGLNWWAAIALTSILIRCATVPLMIHQSKATSKLSAMKPELEELKDRLQNTADPYIVQENHRKVKELFKRHGVSPFTPLKGVFIQAPVFISFYLAISNMVEKVPSFKEGGIFWFTDLTTPDPYYAFPILTGLTFLVTVELNMQEGLEPMTGNMKKFSRLLAFLTVPFTASFPKAIFCYWMTSNFFSLIYGAVLKRPQVREYLNLPAVNAHPSTSAAQPSFPFLAGSNQVPASPSPLAASLEPSQRRVSSSVIQRIQTLEKSVKAKNRPKKKRSAR